MISSQIQITHAKKMNIVHMMLRKGYESASTIICTFRRGKRDYACVTTLEASSHRDDRLALLDAAVRAARAGEDRLPHDEDDCGCREHSDERREKGHRQYPQCSQPWRPSWRPHAGQRYVVRRCCRSPVPTPSFIRTTPTALVSAATLARWELSPLMAQRRLERARPPRVRFVDRVPVS